MYAVNTLFELVGAWLAWESVRKIKESRVVSGVLPAQIAFSVLWALEAVPYYLSVGHTLCALVALVRAAGCLVWSLRAWARQ